MPINIKTLFYFIFTINWQYTFSLGFDMIFQRKYESLFDCMNLSFISEVKNWAFWQTFKIELTLKTYCFTWVFNSLLWMRLYNKNRTNFVVIFEFQSNFKIIFDFLLNFFIFFDNLKLFLFQSHIVLRKFSPNSFIILLQFLNKIINNY